MSERRLQEKQFDLLYAELRRVGDALENVERRLEVLESIPPAVMELSRLTHSLEALAYAALGREGPRVQRRRRA
jgi:hypothetical protein